jgi:radical SAM superfamily enzyme YgiQ (UPF0313 family)
MQLCLINAGTGTEFSDTTEFKLDSLRRRSSEPQLGILSLAAVLEAQECIPSLVDLNRSFYEFADLVGSSGIDGFSDIAAAQIASIDSDVFGFGSICSTYPLTVRIAKAVKVLRPDSTIVFGGPQASVVSDQTLATFPFVDYVLRGEAEQTLPIFLEELSGSRKFDRVPGLTHRSLFGIQHNPDGPLVLDMDVLPTPAYHLTGELHGASRASLELGRGCPFACTFCSTNDFFRRKFRLRSPQRVLQDMRAIEAEYGIRDFNLVHDMFTVDAKRVKEFCNALLDSGEGYTWACSARTDCVDEELIELMAAAGCKSVFFGVEAGSERIQRIINKHLDTQRAHNTIDIAQRVGMRSTISLITGFPQENRDDLRATLEMFMHSARTPLSSPQLNLLAPLANTPLHREFKDVMTLDLLCSDMSHQGRQQHNEDMELIRAHRDIFPNFYLLPTPELDRGMLLELREFTLMAESRFRWLFGAADQASAGILELSSDWMEMREKLYPSFAGSDLRHYYRTQQFASDFISFLRQHAVGRSPLLQVFLDFEEGIKGAEPPDASGLASATQLYEREPLDWSDIPLRTQNSRVVRLSADLEEMIEAVRDRREPNWDRSPQCYVVAQVADIDNPISHVSTRIATVVEACNGRRTMSQVVKHLDADQLEVTESEPDYVVVRLIEKARAEGLVAIFRTSSDATESHDAGPFVSEYDAISAAASAQNQFSAQPV